MSETIRHATFLERLMFRIGLRRGFVVKGNSMLPVLADGDAVLVDIRSTICSGDVVVARHPYKQSVQIIKRVTAINDAGHLELTGDKPDESTDSRTFGLIAREMIVGKVVCRLPGRRQ
jgi:nickel-type superoxide dismutase maturation protease